MTKGRRHSFSAMRNWAGRPICCIPLRGCLSRWAGCYRISVIDVIPNMLKIVPTGSHRLLVPQYFELLWRSHRFCCLFVIAKYVRFEPWSARISSETGERLDFNYITDHSGKIVAICKQLSQKAIKHCFNLNKSAIVVNMQLFQVMKFKQAQLTWLIKFRHLQTLLSNNFYTQLFLLNGLLKFVGSRIVYSNITELPKTTRNTHIPEEKFSTK